MKKTMKKLIFVLLFCVLSSFCFSQSFDFIEEVVNSKEVSFLQVTTLVSQDLSLVSDSSENVDEDNVSKDEGPSRDLSDVQITGENYDEIIEDEIQEQKQKTKIKKL